MNKPLPIIALIGQPNVGKSTLLNKIAGQSRAITSEISGTTRDRQYSDAGWNGANFTLVDTAGFNAAEGSDLQLSLHRQIDVALAQADILVLVVDGKQPPAAVDEATLKKIRAAGKPVILAINKTDSPFKQEEKLGEFARLGIKPAFSVSALTGAGLGDMLDELAQIIKQSGLTQNQREVKPNICLSLVGKPNVGKSSIFNAILKEERVVVSPIPGTTRAAIDSELEINGVDYTFIDTAGLKKKAYRQDQPDVFAGFQTFKAIRKSDVCFLVLDAEENISKQDQHIAQEIFAMQKGCIILANKVDLVRETPSGRNVSKAKDTLRFTDEQEDPYQSLRDRISAHFPFLWMCPLFFISAKTGQGLEEAINAAQPIFDRRHKQIDNQTLSEFLNKLLKKNPPKLLRDQKHPKVFSLHQLDTNPPKFELVVNHPAAISLQFRKFVENSIIRDLDFYGTPITLKLRGKDKT